MKSFSAAQTRPEKTIGMWLEWPLFSQDSLSLSPDLRSIVYAPRD